MDHGYLQDLFMKLKQKKIMYKIKIMIYRFKDKELQITDPKTK